MAAASQVTRSSNFWSIEVNFRHNVLRMFAGTVVAQVLPLLATPLLARLFEPGAFGMQYVFMGLATALATVATCRLELAMVLSEREEDAHAVAGLILMLTAVTGSITILTVATSGGVIAELAGFPGSTLWLWLLPPTILALSVFQISVAYASRRNRFDSIASATSLNHGGFVASALLTGSISAVLHGLVTAKVAGQFFAAILISRTMRADWRHIRLTESAGRARELCRHNVQFLIFNTPYSLSGTLMRDLPLFLISSLVSAVMTGQFALARLLTSAPASFVSASISPVFFREAALHRNSPHLHELATTLLRQLAIATAPLFACVMVWGDLLFPVVFGASWVESGKIAMILAPAAWCAVQTAWPERLFEVHGRQGVALTLQLTADVITALAFLGTLLGTEDVLHAMMVLSGCQLIYHHAYAFTVFRVAGFRMGVVRRSLAAGWTGFALFAIFLVSVRIVLAESSTAAAISAVICTAAATFLTWRVWQSLGRSHVMLPEAAQPGHSV